MRFIWKSYYLFLLPINDKIFVIKSFIRFFSAHWNLNNCKLRSKYRFFAFSKKKIPVFSLQKSLLEFVVNKKWCTLSGRHYPYTHRSQLCLYLFACHCNDNSNGQSAWAVQIWHGGESHKILSICLQNRQRRDALEPKPPNSSSFFSFSSSHSHKLQSGVESCLNLLQSMKAQRSPQPSAERMKYRGHRRKIWWLRASSAYTWFIYWTICLIRRRMSNLSPRIVWHRNAQKRCAVNWNMDSVLDVRRRMGQIVQYTNEVWALLACNQRILHLWSLTVVASLPSYNI